MKEFWNQAKPFVLFLTIYFVFCFGINLGGKFVESQCKSHDQLVIDDETYLCLKVHKLEGTP